jgi:hypothetical protein
MNDKHTRLAMPVLAALLLCLGACGGGDGENAAAGSGVSALAADSFIARVLALATVPGDGEPTSSKGIAATAQDNAENAEPVPMM